MPKRLILFIRISLFIIYFWFGILKVLNLSPAEPLVLALFDKTLAFLLPFNIFYILFAVFECILGIMFLIKGLEKISLLLVCLHIFTTAIPLLLVPEFTWSAPFVLTLAGQYIVKNLLIISSALTIYYAKEKY